MAATRKAQAKQIKEQKRAIKKYETNYGKLKKRRLKKWAKDSINVPVVKRDSLGAIVWTKEDSLAVAEEVLADLPHEYREIVLNPVDIDSLVLAYAGDSTVPESVLENQAKEYLPDELGQPGEDPLGGLPSDPTQGLGTQGVEALSKPTRPNPNLVKPEVARDLFKKIDPEQFQKVQEDISQVEK